MGKFDFTFSFMLILTFVFSLCWLKTESKNLYQHAYVQIPNFPDLPETPEPEEPEPQNNDTVSENVQVYMFMNASLMFDLHAETIFQVINEGSEHYWISYTVVPESLNFSVRIHEGKFNCAWYTWSRAHMYPSYSWKVHVQNLNDCNASITFVAKPYDGKGR